MSSGAEKARSETKMSAKRNQPLRAGIVGTGYIAEFHARALQCCKGVELVSVCDSNVSSANSFAKNWGLPAAFSTLDIMLQEHRLDTVHILVPPDFHHALAKTALEHGVHVFLEKPMCASVQEADQLLALARSQNLRVGINHNMLFSGAYQILRKAVRSELLGPIDYICVNHFQELVPIRSGPFGSWMLRSSGNALLEIGPHLVSAVHDLVGKPEIITVTADREAILPGGVQILRRWRIQARVGQTAIDININLGPGFNQRTINIRGLAGLATLDFDSNICTVDRRTPSGIDFDRYQRSRLLARQTMSQARKNLSDYLLTKLKLRRRGNPYQISFLDSIAIFYADLQTNMPPDKRVDGASGRDVIDSCEKIIQTAGIKLTERKEKPQRGGNGIRPSVLVFGASGFIGRELVRQLLAAGYYVRAVARASSILLDELQNGRLEIMRGDMRVTADVKAAMHGIEMVFHLARADAKTWEDNVQRDIEPTRLIGEMCLAAGVKRLIYTGTIDSYYAGARAGVITEQTPLDPNIHHRNYYARAKAAAEDILMEMHRSKGLPVVVVRPGIVIGQGGNPFHWGVGMWVGENICNVWGDGNNKLPFVLVADVASALVRSMLVTGIEGRSYNLIDEPLLTASDYLYELQRRSKLPLRVRYMPIWRFYIADLAKWLIKLTVGHPDRIRVPNYFDWESRTQKATFDCSRTRVDLGWAPASNRQRLIDEGIGGSLQSWLTACR